VDPPEHAYEERIQQGRCERGRLVYMRLTSQSSNSTNLRCQSLGTTLVCFSMAAWNTRKFRTAGPEGESGSVQRTCDVHHLDGMGATGGGVAGALSSPLSRPPLWKVNGRMSGTQLPWTIVGGRPFAPVRVADWNVAPSKCAPVKSAPDR
jgi:hypothetical protein